MVLFKDLNKTSTDLLVRDFAHDRPWDVDFKHQSKNPVFLSNAYINGGGVFDAVSSAKYLSPLGSFEAKMGTSTATFDAQYQAPIKGLTLGSRLDRRFNAKGPQDTVDLSADFLAPNGAHCRLSINPLVPAWTASALASINASENSIAKFGGELNGSTDLRGITYSMGASFAQNTKDVAWTAALRTFPLNGNAFGKLAASVHAKANRPGASEFSAEVTHNLPTSKTDVAFVGLWFLDQPFGGGRSNTFLKAKMTQDAQVATSLTHKFSDSLTATFGARIDAGKGPSSMEAVKYGMKLAITA